MANNPTGLFLDKETVKMATFGSYSAYLKRNMKQFSLIRVYYGSPQETVITKDAKVTVPDMISNIGGTLGIFLGLSTISLLDRIIEWLGQFREMTKSRKKSSFFKLHF